MTCLVLKTDYFQAYFYYHGVADRVCLLILQSVLVQVLTAYLGSLSEDYRYGMYIGMTGFFFKNRVFKNNNLPYYMFIFHAGSGRSKLQMGFCDILH